MIFFQLIRKEDGTRSRALPAKPGDLRDVIDKIVPVKNRDKFFILVLVDDAKNEDFVFSTAPLLSVDTFMHITREGVTP